MILVHDVGTGDFFNFDSFLSPGGRASLEAIHHAFYFSEGSQALISVMDACPAYRHVKHVQMAYPTEHVPGSIKTMRDHAISHLLTYSGSAFLSGPLDCPPIAGLPDRFDLIVPDTPKNGPHCPRLITDSEWPVVLDRLEARDTIGLVVNAPGGKSNVTDHPRIVNLTGKTSLPQAIEVLKRASGYIGVDSCLAILAAQLFDSADLLVRTTNSYIYQSPWLHYPPRADYSFLYPRFDRPPHPDPGKPSPILGGQVIELRCNALVGSRNFTTGDRVEVPSDRAALMLACGQAVPLDAI